MNIKPAVSDAEIDACFPVVSQLRPHVTREEFVARVRRQEQAGYCLAYVEMDGRPVAVAGFRTLDTLWAGRLLYVDDLVTDEAMRSNGHGAALLAWLRAHAAASGCASLHLDTGVQRADAQRFYERENMRRTAYHYEAVLGSKEKL